MADSNSPTGVSIPQSSIRTRAKAFSVSLHDNMFDVSEVSVEDINSQACSEDVNDCGKDRAGQTCPSCGQTVPSSLKNGKARPPVDSISQLSRSLPTHFGTSLTPRNYESTLNGNDGFSDQNGLEHCHGERISQPDIQAKRSLITASVLCLIFMLGEIVGGYMANSLAIATDAAHLLTDFASFMISLFSLWLATRPATKSMSFGWYRAEVIGALISVLLIWVVTGVLVFLAIQRLVNREFDIDAKVMLITSGVGVIVNLLMGFTLHQHGHSHSGRHGHGHSHSNNSSQECESQPLLANDDAQNKNTNINVRAAFIHVVGDFIQSLGVFIAALVIYFKPDLTIIDPICTFLFSIIVLFTTVAILKDALTVLMEGLPRGLDFNMVQETFLSIDGVVRVHNLRIWALSMDKIALAAHLAVRPEVKTQAVLLQASRLARSRFNVFEMTLQIEEFELGMEDCTQCKDPAD